jgi:acetyl esterase/lipase
MLLGGVLGVVLLIWLVARKPDPSQPVSAGPESTTIRRIAVGSGPRGATIVVQGAVDRPRPVVMFLHGWRLLGPEAYKGWIDHLARAGNAVVVPRYERATGQRTDQVLDNAIAGLRAALARVRVDMSSLVVAGHSAGAAIAVDYAATAPSARLPKPKAVFAVYPGRAIRGEEAIPEADASQIPPATRIVALAGSKDEIVGDQPAEQVVASATSVPEQRRQLIRIDDPEAAGHFDPVLDRPAVRREIWQRLDRLIAAARQRGDSQ